MLSKIAYELHRPARKTFPRRKIVSLFKDDLWQADLIDMQSYSRTNKGFKFILIIIDTYTKYVWTVPLKNKSSKEVTQGMLIIFTNNYPKLLQTDNSREFYNKPFQDVMKKYNVKHYSTYSSIKAGIVERVIRTIKNKIYTYFTATGSWNWFNSLQNIVHNYNNTIHKTINCTPFEARLNTNKIQYNKTKQFKIKKSALKIGDKVRISKYKHIFNKGYTRNWTTEVFTISKVYNTNPITYQIKEGKNNIILGCFYEQEIKLTNYPNTYLVERVVRRKKKKIFVKWLDFDSTHTSWISVKDILK